MGFIVNFLINDWDYCGLLLDGWEIYNLEAYENEYKGMIPIEVTTVEKTVKEYAVDILMKEKDCYFDELDVEIVAEAYIAGYKDAINKRI